MEDRLAIIMMGRKNSIMMDLLSSGTLSESVGYRLHTRERFGFATGVTAAVAITNRETATITMVELTVMAGLTVKAVTIITVAVTTMAPAGIKMPQVLLSGRSLRSCTSCNG